MADQNTPVDAAAQSADPTASDRSAGRWRLIVLALGGAGALLIIAVIALQVTEYRFYSAPPSVWPQPGAKAVVSAPVPPPQPVTPLTSAVAPEAKTTAPLETASLAAITTATETATSLEMLSQTGAVTLAEEAASVATVTALESIVSAEVFAETSAVPAEGATSALPATAAQAEVPEIMIGSNEAAPLMMETNQPAVGAGEVAVPGGVL